MKLLAYIAHKEKRTFELWKINYQILNNIKKNKKKSLKSYTRNNECLYL